MKEAGIIFSADLSASSNYTKEKAFIFILWAEESKGLSVKGNF